MNACPPNEPCPRVAVRALCAFAARSGDLDLRFTPSPSAADGIAGHATVTSRRGPDYQRELPLAALCAGLQLQGRADGVDLVARRLEEIKTHRGDAQHIATNQRALHWAQAKLYGWMLCEQQGWDGLEVALVYFHIDTGEETVLTEWCEREALAAHAQDLCQRYRQWAHQEAAHRAARDAALAALRFPFGEFRAGQRELTEAVFRTQRGGRHLLAQAPTGIGKTVATLFATLRAMPEAQGDQLLYLTPKTPGRQLALDGLRRLNAQPLRVLERVARDKACEHPEAACHGEACPLARGFYDRLPAARQEAAQAAWLDAAALRRIALAHGICPYYLGQEMQRWADVVVGDVNHYFDISAQAWALAVAQEWRVHLLLDEAHALVERARGMHSAELNPASFEAARAQAPQALRREMARLHRHWGELGRDLRQPWQPLADLPQGFVQALRQHVGTLTDHLASHPSASAGALQTWLFDALQWLRVAETFGEHALADLSATPRLGRSAPRPRLAIRNVLPAPLLAPRWASAHSATLFSATLAPMDHIATLLGLPEGAARLAVPSPFPPEHLQVRVLPKVSTRYADRARSLPLVVRAMAEQFQAQPGNYLAFFSSFDYLQQALDAFSQAHPEVPVWQQARGPDEAARAAFLTRFGPESQGIGFAVLGGAFGEGIDLPGRRLIGAFIATLGLPPVNPVNERLRERLQQITGHGFEHTYLYPGLHKVVQAAGRVIRTPEDQGVVVLMDDRFSRPDVRALLPPWWRL